VKKGKYIQVLDKEEVRMLVPAFICKARDLMDVLKQIEKK
jgi:hypothetical protein